MLIKQILEENRSISSICVVCIAFIINKNKEYILAHPELNLTEKQYKQLKNLLSDYKRGKPLAYILRNKEFYGRNYIVTQDTLIPRPETELLVELSIDFADHCDQELVNILEIGTGSGCIPITLVAECKKDIHIDSIDISTEALKIATKNRNTLLNKTQQRKITFKNQDIFLTLGPKKYDLIISNPPYVTTAEYTLLGKNITDFEPPMAFLGGDDGLKFYHRIHDMLPKILDDTGLCLLEMNSQLGQQTTKIFSQNWATAIYLDYQRLPRVISISRRPFQFGRYNPRG